MASIGYVFIAIPYTVVLILLHRSLKNAGLERRIELSTPATSWYRVKECVALIENGIDAYSGDICHQPPLLVDFYHYVLKKGDFAVLLLFVVLHVVTGLLLAMGANKFLTKKIARERSESDRYKEDARKLWLTTINISTTGYLTLAIYYLNPYSILSCLAFSTGLVTNLTHAVVFYSISTDHLVIGSLAVGLASYISFYSMVTLLPIVVHSIYRAKNKGRAFFYVKIALFTAIVLVCQSRRSTGSWNFLYATHGFLWDVPDLTPNVGLFWYFFMEMFDHFRSFFLWVFQINAFIYIIPMGLLFRRRPVFLFYILTSLLAIMKSYPEVGDICIPLALLPMWSYLYRYMRSPFIIFCIFMFTSVLGPVLYYLWIYVGSANANFFYAVTLAYGLGQIFLVTDMIIAYLKREFHLVHGLQPVTDDGEPGVVQLK